LSTAAPSLRAHEMSDEDVHLHLAWLYANAQSDHGRDQFRVYLAAAKQSPRTRDAAYLIAASARLAAGDAFGAERDVQEGLRGARDIGPFLEAQLDILLGRDADAAQLTLAANRLRPLATTAGRLCSLAWVARRAGDRKAALELSERGLQLNPRLVACRLE